MVWYYIDALHRRQRGQDVAYAVHAEGAGVHSRSLCILDGSVWPAGSRQAIRGDSRPAAAK